MLSNSCSWNISLLFELFPTSVVNEIRKISISPTTEPHTIFRTPSKSGNFSSKSAYLTDNSTRTHHHPLNTHFLGRRFGMLRFLIDTSFSFGELFMIPCLPKSNWILSSLSLTPFFLCDSEFETVNHLFLTCPFIQQLWFTSKWSFCLTSFINEPVSNWISMILNKNDGLFSNNTIREEFLIYLTVFLDAIWANMNLITHGSYAPCLQITLKKACNLASNQ